MEKNESIRRKFSEFVGDIEIFNKFIRHLNSSGKGRLLYKQEARWIEFQKEYLDREYTYSEIQEIFRICEVHNTVLQRDTVKVREGHLDYSREYEHARATFFPYSVEGPIYVWNPQGAKSWEVWYCQECRNAKEQFNIKHRK